MNLSVRRVIAALLPVAVAILHAGCRTSAPSHRSAGGVAADGKAPAAIRGGDERRFNSAPITITGPTTIIVGGGTTAASTPAGTGSIAAADAPVGETSARSVVVDKVAPKYSKFRQRQAGFSPADQARVDRNCPFGLPKHDPAFEVGPCRYAAHDGYVLEHSSTDKVPLWVCEHLTAAQLQGSLSRSNRFRPDPQLPKGERSELNDYRGSGFDRGHNAPAGDQTVDERLKDETFFLSNMAPQAPQLNQRVWAELEDVCRQWTIKYGEAHVITGGFFYDPEEETDAADGVIPVERIGPGAVAVPTHFFKIFVAKDGQGRAHAIGFVFENRGYPAPHHFADEVKSIDWIEEHTGFDFMPELDPQEELRLERQPTPIADVGQAS